MQGTEELTSDLKELSEQFEQSLLVRSKPMQQRTWLRKLKRDSWTRLLFGRTLKPSLGSSFTEKWTSLVEASLASHLVVRVGEQETKIRDIFGHTSCEESDDWEDLPLFSLRTSKESSAQKSKPKDGQTPSVRQFCSMCLESWKKWVTHQRQVYLARAKSVPPIKENECLFLQYQTNSQEMDVILSQSSSTEKNWATPTVMDSASIQRSEESLIRRATTARKGRKDPGTLNDQVNPLAIAVYKKNWATPTTMDHLTQKSTETLIRQATTVRKGRTAPSNLREQVDPIAVEIYQQLNDSTQKSTEQPTLHLEDKNSTTGKPQEQHPKKQNWATPTARDWKGHCSKESQKKKKRTDLPNQAHVDTYKEYLNPRWVEQLMGLPVGWTMVSCSQVTITEQTSLDCSETESFLIVQQKLSKPCGKNWSTPSAREHLAEYNIESLIRKDGKSRLDQLGNQVRYTEEDVEKCRQIQAKNWPTPPASQRGEDLEVYIRKSIDRIKKGGVKFAPTLQVAVEAEDKQIEIDSFKKHDIDIEDETEFIVKSIMKDFYKKDSQKNTQETK